MPSLARRVYAKRLYRWGLPVSYARGWMRDCRQVTRHVPRGKLRKAAWM